jgi:hypothetical protein
MLDKNWLKKNIKGAFSAELDKNLTKNITGQKK